MSASKPSLIVLVGPTAVGKTALSIRLAEAMDGEIVSADSRLFYRGMNIGTAKPSTEELARVPHHLIDVAAPDETWTLQQFQENVFEIVGQINARGRVPILVGGTGQYIRAVVEGWSIPEQEPDEQLREALGEWGEQIGAEALFERLRALDPVAAEKMDARNVRRTLRALEVIFNTGVRFSEQRRKKEIPFRILQVGLIRPRDELYQRIDQRLEQMMDDGLLDEIRGLIEKYPPELPSFSGIGYRQIIAYLQSEYDLEEALIRIRRDSRTFVRRQHNWFKPDDPRIHWYFPDEEGFSEILELVREFIKSKDK